MYYVSDSFCYKPFRANELQSAFKGGSQSLDVILGQESYVIQYKPSHTYIILEHLMLSLKDCIKFLWTLFNSRYDIYRTKIKYSLHNRNTTWDEKVRYFMHKYNIVFTDCFENINILYNKIVMYVKHNVDAESFYVGNMIRELCEARDKCCSQFFERGELLRMIVMVTNQNRLCAF